LALVLALRYGFGLVGVTIKYPEGIAGFTFFAYIHPGVSFRIRPFSAMKLKARQAGTPQEIVKLQVGVINMSSQ
jgi:hypothetical protein